MGRDLLAQARVYVDQSDEFLRPRQDNDYASIASWMWHYTAPTAVESIFRSGRLWASHAGDLNDSGEIEFGREVLLNTYHRMQAGSYYNESFASAQQQHRFIALGEALEARQHKPIAADYYLLCASADFDVLNQWQHYGSHGYAIGLPAGEKLAVAIETEGQGPSGPTRTALPLSWRRVLYREEEQITYAASRIMAFVEDTPPLDTTASGTPSNDRAWQAHVEDYFAPVVGLMKHGRFEAERECRILIADRTATHSTAGGFMHVLGDQFRQFHTVGGLVEDAAAGASVGRLPLAELRLGPMIRGVRERRLESAQRMLKLYNHPFVNRTPGTVSELVETADATTAEYTGIVGLSYSEIPYAPAR